MPNYGIVRPFEPTHYGHNWVIIGFILPGESNEVWMTIQDLLVIEGRLVGLTLRELIDVWTFTFYSVFQFDEIIHVENAIFGCQQAYLSATVDECVINSRSRTTALNYVYNKISDIQQKYKVYLILFFDFLLSTLLTTLTHNRYECFMIINLIMR